MEETLFDFTEVGLSAEPVMNVQMILLIVLVLFVLFVFFGLAISLRRLLTRPDMHGLSREQVQARWQEIERISEQGMMGQKMAIVEADKLLDSALKSLSMPGDTMGERLKIAGYKYPELRKAWVAHKLRNHIVHESSFEMKSSQAKHALHEFKKALKVLNVM